MSVIKYRGVTLEIVATREVLNLPILSSDRTSYLYTQRTIDFDCWYNPRATAFTGSGIVAPVAQVGRYPFETDHALQQYLSQPRGILEVEMGNGQIIRSPRLNSLTDAKNGPVVEACEVRKVQGLKTWSVRFRITTWINECYEKSSSPVGNPLLAHRWTQYADVDHDHFTTRITHGEAIFNVDAILSLGTYPDAYRNEFMHPVPPNFQRGPIRVEAISDGTGIRYTITDTEKPFNFGTNCAATRIEAYQTAWYSEPSAGQQIGGIVDAFGNIAGIFGTGGAALAFGRGQAAAQAGGRILPRYYSRVFCRAWGNRDSNRVDLTNLGLILCSTRIGVIGWRASECSVTHDLNGKFVECDLTVNWGMDTAIAQNVFAGIGNGIGNAVVPNLGGVMAQGPPTTWNELLNTFVLNERIDVPQARLTLNSDPGTGNPLTRVGRGTTLVKIMAQVLSGDCATPPAPPAYVPVAERVLVF